MLGDKTLQSWVIKLSQRISTKKAKEKVPFSGGFSRDGEEGKETGARDR